MDSNRSSSLTIRDLGTFVTIGEGISSAALRHRVTAPVEKCRKVSKPRVSVNTRTSTPSIAVTFLVMTLTYIVLGVIVIWLLGKHVIAQPDRKRPDAQEC